MWKSPMRTELRAARILVLTCMVAAAQPPQRGFDLVDIHASAPNTMPEMRTHLSRGRYELKNATMGDLIRPAWGVDADKVVGGPDWLDLDRFDVIAPVPATPGVTAEALQPMLR